ncbi:Rab-gap TBC domain-containing protein [Vairimorpha necatrix]|uniref:Rab-gap TBC domain-containing protein n=1 Tax=Vairimorpha necatrix TaxID=6039 RepID=A0AAX4J823_9MICR
MGNIRTRSVNIDSKIEKQINPKDCMAINLFQINNYIYCGFSSSIYRPKYWKILLGYYSTNKFKSSIFYMKQRYSYSIYIKDLSSIKNQYFKIIENDVSRMCIEPIIINKKEKCGFLDTLHLKSGLTRRDILIRILKCFVVHNKSVGYIQGMIMVLIPIYHVFIYSEDIEDYRNSEEDAFFCFNFLASHLFEKFISEIDNEQNLLFLMSRVWKILKNVDYELYRCCLNKKIIECHIYLKWILFIFSTEFKMEDTQWLWDRILSDSNRFEIVYYCVAAIFKIFKETIIKESYEIILEQLQNISLLDVKKIFYIANELRSEIIQFNVDI